MPKEGICHLILNKRKDGLQIIFEKTKVTVKGNTQASQLFPEMRLLHNMVGRIFFSKTGHFDWVIEKDIAFIYYLAKGHPVNLPYLMMSQMKEVARKSRACLPYGMVFILLFEEFGVDCTDEDAKRLLHTDRYTKKSLHQMGIQKVEGRWIRNILGQKAAESDSKDILAADIETMHAEDDDVGFGSKCGSLDFKNEYENKTKP